MNDETSLTNFLRQRKFRKFTDSRWVTVRASCRALWVAVHTGVQGLVALIRSDKKNSDYWLHGFERLSAEIIHLCAMTSFAASVPDELLLEFEPEVPDEELL